MYLYVSESEEGEGDREVGWRVWLGWVRWAVVMDIKISIYVHF